MKLILGPLLLTCLICAVMAEDKPGSVTVSGTDIVPGQPGGTNAGSVVSSSKEADLIRGISSQVIQNQLLPSWCAYTDKECPGLKDSDFTQQPGTAKEDCMSACKAMSGCMITEFSSGTCSLSSQPCNTGPNAENLIPSMSKGTTLMVRRTAGDPSSCPGGAGPVGLPEDQFTSEFCISSNLRCPTDKNFRAVFKATVEQCKYECNAYAACAEAVFTLGTGDLGMRYCYLLDRPCQPAELIPDPLSTTLYRMPRAQYNNYKKGLSGTDICPLGGIRYTIDAGPGYTDKFCLLPTRQACPTSDGNMYIVPGQDLNRDQCLAKCLVYATCGMVEWYQIIDNNGIFRNRCNMKDTPLCSDDDLVPAPPPYITLANKAFIKPVYPDYQHLIRLKVGDNGICPGKYGPVPGSIPWSAKFCIWYDRVCPAKYAPVLSVTPATDLNDCLTQCYRSTANSCKSVTFEGGQCTQLSGICTQQQLTITLFKMYYVRQSDVNAVCPALTCQSNSSPKEAPMTPNTCANPNAAAGCTIVTNRCVCDDGFLDQEGMCVNKDDCPVICPQKTPYTPVLVASTQFSDVWRYYNFQSTDADKPCGVGASVQLMKPCPNTSTQRTANDDCERDPAWSCHCTDHKQVWDEIKKACVV